MDNKNPANNRGFTPLYVAAENGHIEVCKLIIENMVGEKNLTGPNGFTPIHLAVQNRHKEIYKILIENVEEMNPKDDYGTTPLDIAAQNNDIDIFEAIFEDASYCKDLEVSSYLRKNRFYILTNF